MQPRIIVEHDVTITLRDGIETRADIFRVDDDVPRPAILQRSIYGKQGYMEHAYAGPMDVVRAGYVYVSQDCRGCGASDGFHEFFFQEQADGYDSVQWVASQPWSSGRVGVIGNSALAMTALQAVAAQPPSLAAAFVVDGHTDMETWTKRGGASSEFYFASQFLPQIVALNNLARLGLDDDRRGQLLQTIMGAVRATREDLLALPVLDLEGLRDDEVTSGLRSIFLAEPTDPFWQRDSTSIGKDPTRARVPIKAIAGIFSPFAEALARVCAANPELGHELILGPWGHYGVAGAATGTTQYLDAPSGARKGWASAMLAWFDQWMGPNSAQQEPQTSATYFFSGENRWASSASWPPEGHEIELFLDSASPEGGEPGSGILARRAPTEGLHREFTYDPADPVPTIGGVMIDVGQVARFDPTLTSDGPHDQREVESREDVLVYTSPDLDEVIRVAGSPTASLWVTSDAEDTDFIVRLVDVEPGGRATNLSEGIMRMRYRDGRNDSWMVAGEPVEVAIRLDPVAHSFMPGHRIRIHVTSSSFPKYTRNLNSRAVPEQGLASDIVVARQRVHSGSGMASRIALPTVDRSAAAWPYNSPATPRPAGLDDRR